MRDPTAARLPAIDAMRGVVIVLMALDHASYAFNAGRYVTDSIALYQPGSVIPAVPFLLRWVTHICAPTFVFLAGFSMACSIARKQSGGVSARHIDRDLAVRGIFILLLDPLWMSPGFGERMVFQVLYAIGGGFCCLVILRRMRAGVLVGVGMALVVVGEALAGIVLWLGGGAHARPIGALLVTGGRLGSVAVALYPLLPWLAYMVLGLGCGRLLQHGAIRNPVKGFAIAGLAQLSLFVVIRGLNSYGNMRLLRDDGSLLQWLHVSKYPPSLTFSLLTLGCMCLFLAPCFQLYAKGSVNHRNPMLVFGRAPLLFYILHVHLLGGSAVLLGVWKRGGLAETFIATGVVLAVLYPLCRWYAKFRQAHPRGIWRFI